MPVQSTIPLDLPDPKELEMELHISNADAKALGLNSRIKEKIVGLVHAHIGLASMVSVTLENPETVQLKTSRDRIIVDRALTRRID